MQHPITEILRIGTVVTKDPVNMRCRVEFTDSPTNPVTTYWLPVLVTRAYNDTYYDLPDIGSKVLCAFLPNGMETSFILGSYYPDNWSPCADEDVYQHKFKDGTYIEYNRKEHKLTASCVGDVEMEVQGNVKVAGKNIYLYAEEVLDLQAGQKVNCKRKRVGLQEVRPERNYAVIMLQTGDAYPLVIGTSYIGNYVMENIEEKDREILGNIVTRMDLAVSLAEGPQ